MHVILFTVGHCNMISHPSWKAYWRNVTCKRMYLWDVWILHVNWNIFLCVIILSLSCMCRLWKVQQAEAAHIHPSWNGKDPYRYDAALLRLSIRVTVPTPVLADTNFHLYPNLQFHMLTLLTGLEIVEMNADADGIFRLKRCLYNGIVLSTDLWQYKSSLVPIWNRSSIWKLKTQGWHTQHLLYFCMKPLH